MDDETRCYVADIVFTELSIRNVPINNLFIMIWIQSILGSLNMYADIDDHMAILDLVNLLLGR